MGSVLREENGTIRQGILLCTNPRCQCEYPIIDGIPIIVADLRTFISQNISAIASRCDFTAEIESLIGDCCGPGSDYNVRRQYLSTYAFDHYGDLDPLEPGLTPEAPGSIVNLARKGLALAGPPPQGPILDLGCAAGRTSFELAHAFGEMVLGIDLNLDMLRTAAGALHEKSVSYPRRRVGMAYDRRGFPVDFPGAEQVDFWACDATALPFAPGQFSLATSFNLMDCVGSPYDHLLALAKMLKPGTRAILSTPYDWSVSATPVESWIGGHSQRSQNRGASEPILRSLLAGGGHPMAIEGLALVAEVCDWPWSVRLHDRSRVQYSTHLAVVEATGALPAETAP
ncbi:MAG: methyltransferase domain-containing protein [Desulfobacterales bacterium]|nr:methyltransferase domain-containing protein [Desulfobacterales bacterium]